MRYNLEVLNDKEFEELAKDLLDSKLKIDLEIFKVGKDGGVDLRCSKRVENSFIVQVKHYVGSKYSNLVSSLQQEKNKLDLIYPIPKRYIVFTSLPLSPQQTKDIKELLSPFVKSTNDIYGRTRVENLLSKNKIVERKFFKLWLTSTNVLESVLHNAVFSNSEFISDKIIQRAKLYVHTENIAKAMTLLEKNKFLIISGEPGVGKTTLAYMLVYQLLGNGFKLIFSDRSIKDVENILTNDPMEKQVVLIDDFLGSNLLDLYQPVNTESRIINFIDRLSSLKNKYLIFTSRTTLLNQANHNYENLRRSGISFASNYELTISGYSLIEKAKMLYNHLYHGDLPTSYAETFYTDQNYLKVVKHKNYYPRLIEFITTERKFNLSGYSNVKDFIFESLDNPDEIWRFAFENQLTRAEQILLETLFSFGDGQIELDIVEESFEYRYKYEVNSGNTQRELNGFQNSLKKLLDGFLKMEIDGNESIKTIGFVNPSIADFLIKYIDENQNEKFNIWASAKYIEQLTARFVALWKQTVIVPQKRVERYQSALICNIDVLDTMKEGYSVAFEILAFKLDFFLKFQSVNFLVVNKLLNRIITEGGKLDSRRLCSVLINLKINMFEEGISIILKNWDRFVFLIIDNIISSGDIELIQSLFNEYGKDFGAYLADDELGYSFHYIVTKLFEQQIEDHDFNSEIQVSDFDYFTDRIIEEKLQNEIDQMYIDFIDYSNLDEYWELLEPSYEVNIADIIYEYKRNLSTDEYIHDYKEYRELTTQHSYVNVEDSIHQLFRR